MDFVKGRYYKSKRYTYQFEDFVWLNSSIPHLVFRSVKTGAEKLVRQDKLETDKFAKELKPLLEE